MSFNPLHEFTDSPSGPAKPERKPPCTRCRTHITFTPPTELGDPRFRRTVQQDICWACYAGHPIITRVSRDITVHPHYIVWLKKLMDRKAAKAERVAVATESV